MMPSIVAMHEAAHAVACLSVGAPMIDIVIDADLEQGTAGMVRHRVPARPDGSPDEQLAAVILLAARAAEREFGVDASNIQSGCGEDVRLACAGADDIFAANRDAVALVRRHWCAIDRLARALDRVRAMSSHAAVAVIVQAEEEWAVAGPMNPGLTPQEYVKRA